MSLLEQINTQVKEAMKAKEKEKLQALRYLKSMLMENQTAKKPIAEMDVVVKYHKKLKDGLAQYPSGHDMIPGIENEIEIIKTFLPEELSEEKVIELIAGIKKKLEGPNMGAIMKELQPLIKGRFDGKRASELVKNSL